MKKINQIIEVLEQVNAKDIKAFDNEDKSPFFQYVIIATVSDRQANAAVGHFKKLNLAEMKNVEGTGSSGWVLVDSSDIIIHLFTKEQREYFAFDQRFLGVKQIN
ncbi:MAG TPA: ribosome silencing factor [Acholeplasmataceae bacterium]|nr:ribosome silencing factor [Acholeplasmataceae bacterium]